VVFGTPDTLNLYYPLQEEPLEKLGRMGVPRLPNLRLTSYKAGAFATLSFERPSAIELARFIDAVFTDVLQCGSECPLTVKLSHLAK
jgi:hypothetical protein